MQPHHKALLLLASATHNASALTLSRKMLPRVASASIPSADSPRGSSTNNATAWTNRRWVHAGLEPESEVPETGSSHDSSSSRSSPRPWTREAGSVLQRNNSQAQLPSLGSVNLNGHSFRRPSTKLGIPDVTPETEPDSDADSSCLSESSAGGSDRSQSRAGTPATCPSDDGLTRASTPHPRVLRVSTPRISWAENARALRLQVDPEAPSPVMPEMSPEALQDRLAYFGGLPTLSPQGAGSINGRFSPLSPTSNALNRSLHLDDNGEPYYQNHNAGSGEVEELCNDIEQLSVASTERSFENGDDSEGFEEGGYFEYVMPNLEYWQVVRKLIDEFEHDFSASKVGARDESEKKQLNVIVQQIIVALSLSCEGFVEEKFLLESLKYFSSGNNKNEQEIAVKRTNGDKFKVWLEHKLVVPGNGTEGERVKRILGEVFDVLEESDLEHSVTGESVPARVWEAEDENENLLIEQINAPGSYRTLLLLQRLARSKFFERIQVAGMSTAREVEEWAVDGGALKPETVFEVEFIAALLQGEAAGKTDVDELSVIFGVMQQHAGEEVSEALLKIGCAQAGTDLDLAPRVSDAPEQNLFTSLIEVFQARDAKARAAVVQQNSDPSVVHTKLVGKNEFKTDGESPEHDEDDFGVNGKIKDALVEFSDALKEATKGRYQLSDAGRKELGVVIAGVTARQWRAAYTWLFS